MNKRWMQLLGLDSRRTFKKIVDDSPIKSATFIARKYRKDVRYVRECLAGPAPTAEEIATLERACQICRRTDSLELDHVVPLCKGGRNEISNRRWLCRLCNRRQPKANYLKKP